ncbi:MAG: universal stress protein, partial [Anaerolineales bacterium]
MFPSARIQSAKQDFRRARQQAALRAIMARLRGKSADLLSFEEVYRQLRATGRAERGLREIPLDAIVGSVGRYADFTRDFLPRQDSTEQRWAVIKAVATDPAGVALPPIEVYQIGDAYFVLDGHHRVSVARELGATHIDAYVTEVRAKVPLSPDVQPDDLILKAEQAEFLDETNLDKHRPEADLSVSVPGQFSRLADHIEAHRYLMEVDQARDIPFEEAAVDWYDNAYLPVVQAIREQGILRDFPGRTEADLYLWVTEHRLALQEELGWSIKPEAAVTDLKAKGRLQRARPISRVGRRILNAMLPDTLATGPAPGEWRKEKIAARYSDRLFADLLVPVSGDAVSWKALDQALAFAQREGAQLRGLHLVSGEAQKEAEAARAVQAEFSRRCEAAGVPGSLAIEAGEITPKICERAVLADLVVLNLAYPPGPQPLARLSSGFSAIIRRCPRPVLAVPGLASPLGRALLAYDDSPKAKEALFVATYLTEQWKIPLVVVTVVEANGTTPETLEHARKYLE